MRSIYVLGISAVFLSGCALPVPLQIASWALDGISVIATQKSVTDHGISLVAQQDCAIWRGVTEGELCRDAEDTDVLVAEREIEAATKDEPQQTASLGLAPVEARPVLRSPVLSTLQVRAVPTHALRAAWKEKSVAADLNTEIGATGNTHALRAIPVKTSRPSEPVRIVEAPLLPAETFKVVKKPKTVPAPKYRHGAVKSEQPRKGIYFVIGSFRNHGYAKRLARGHKNLAPSVLKSKLAGNDVYRVVVGPVPEGREKRLHRALVRDGFPDTWAIRIKASDWHFAKLPQPHSKAVVEVATLQR